MGSLPAIGQNRRRRAVNQDASSFDPGGTIPHLSEDRILDLLHGLLPGGERRDTIQHLERCPHCEQTMQLMVAERERLRATRRLEVDPSGALALVSQATGRFEASPEGLLLPPTPMAPRTLLSPSSWTEILTRPLGRMRARIQVVLGSLAPQAAVAAALTLAGLFLIIPMQLPPALGLAKLDSLVESVRGLRLRGPG